MNKDYQIVTFKDEDFSIDIKISLDEETIWMTQKEIASVFETSTNSIIARIKSLKLENKLLDSDSNRELITAQDGKKYNTKIYNLEIITLLSYKVRSKRAPKFISWANNIIKELKEKQQLEMTDSYNNLLHSNKYEIIRYENDGLSLDVNITKSDHTAWLTVDQIAMLYGRERSVIAKHIKNIFEEHEKDKNSVCAFFAHTGPDGKNYTVTFYNIELIMAVGYRVKSPRGIDFRNWMTEIGKKYLNATSIFHENSSEFQIIQLANEIYGVKEEVKDIKEIILKSDVTTFLPGQFFEASLFLSYLYKLPIKEIIVIDPYLDSTIANYIIPSKNKIHWILVCREKHDMNLSNKLENVDISIKLSNLFHDRFIIIDRKIIYHLGASINYLGKSITIVSRIDNSKWQESFLLSILNVLKNN